MSNFKATFLKAYPLTFYIEEVTEKEEKQYACILLSGSMYGESRMFSFEERRQIFESAQKEALEIVKETKKYQ